MEKVTTASGDYIVYFHPLIVVPNVFIRNGTYPLMFIGRVYNNICLWLSHIWIFIKVLSTINRLIWPIDRILGQSRPCSIGNKGILYILQSFSIGVSLSAGVKCHIQDESLLERPGIFWYASSCLLTTLPSRHTTTNDEQETIIHFLKSAKAFGLKINLTKIKVMYQPLWDLMILAKTYR